MTVQTRPWISLEDIVSDDHSELLCALPESVTEAAAVAAIDIASTVLYELTGRRWSGVEESAVRPSAQDSSSNELVPGWNETWGEYDSTTGSCVPVDRIDLGYFPVIDVLQVRIDGAVLMPSAYQLQEQRFLVRIDGGTWPCTQDLSANPSANDTFEVQISHGIEPPDAGKYCCAIYAVELAKSFCNLDCSLPQRAQYVTRQGVSTILMDPLNVVFRGMIGMPTVDSWIRSVNPKGRRKRTMVVSGRNVQSDVDSRPPLSGSRLYADFYGYPYRSINRFYG